ncbi:hypothetical protein CTR2_R29710 [Comamonas thiooxydans]|uniref:hypothetical protein n=1 Tax=Comamonas thiooxydans TaxID=363952 RepID=UPI00111EFA39|nr:hypothetical protein [Comamonas thiooxydans]BDR09633.1 hypothetical protein CTR2_R29710 [Comamonas thiooxydans]
MTKPASHLDRYQAVQWRGTTPVSDGWICFSFARDAEVLRIRLPVEGAHGLVETAASYLGRWGVQSPGKALPIAQVALDLLPGGLVRITSTCKGAPDASYAPMQDLRVAAEVEKLVNELRDRLSRELS